MFLVYKITNLVVLVHSEKNEFGNGLSNYKVNGNVYDVRNGFVQYTHSYIFYNRILIRFVD